MNDAFISLVKSWSRTPEVSLADSGTSMIPSLADVTFFDVPPALQAILSKSQFLAVIRGRVDIEDTLILRVRIGSKVDVTGSFGAWLNAIKARGDPAFGSTDSADLCCSIRACKVDGSEQFTAEGARPSCVTIEKENEVYYLKVSFSCRSLLVAPMGLTKDKSELGPCFGTYTPLYSTSAPVVKTQDEIDFEEALAYVEDFLAGKVL